jgi:hypothetical protein
MKTQIGDDVMRFKDIEGYEGLYQICDNGIVWSSKRNPVRPLKKRLTFDGYVKATLSKDDIAKDFRVHRLVAEYFIPNPEGKETVNHIDGDKENNHYTNLEWATRTEQNLHSYKLGLKQAKLGNENPNSKLNPSQVREIRSSYVKSSKEFGTVALGRKYGVNASVIEKIVKRKSYKNVE